MNEIEREESAYIQKRNQEFKVTNEKNNDAKCAPHTGKSMFAIYLENVTIASQPQCMLVREMESDI